MRIAITVGIAALTLACSDGTSPGIANNPATASDDFERASLGASWSTASGSAAGIVGGQDLGALSTGPLSIDWIATSFAADQFSEVVVAAGKDPNMLVQAHVRRQSSTPARYGFHFNPEKSPAVWEIKYDGVPTPDVRILTSAQGPEPVAGDVLRIEARGREISGYLNGVRILVATDNAANAILAAGRTGITARLKVGTSTTYPTPIVASWKGGSLP